MRRREFLKYLTASGLLATTVGSLTTLLPGCNSKRDYTEDNVILITIDTLRHDYVGCYGNNTINTPALDRIAREGVVCTNAFSHSHITLPSHISIMTSLYPKDHQVQSNIRQELHPNVTTIAEHFQAQGYKTAAIVSMQPLTPEWVKGLERGFDDYLIPEEVERKAEETNKDVFSWLKKNHDRKFFLWIHYFDPHMPYTPPSPYDTLYYHGDPRAVTPDTMKAVRFPKGFYIKPHDRLIQWLDGVKDIGYPSSQYAGEVSYVDHHLGKLLAFLEQVGLDDKALLAVTADHGEALGEHHIYFDHKGLYDQTMHVPLIFRYPGHVNPQMIDGLVGSVDILPTVLEIVGMNVPKTIRGQSLLPLFEGERTELNNRIYGEHVDGSQVMVRTQEWKFIKSFNTMPYHEKFQITKGALELYNLKHDPEELTNIALEHPEMVSRFSNDADEWLGDRMLPARAVEDLMDEESRETLKSLGYVE